MQLRLKNASVALVLCVAALLGLAASSSASVANIKISEVHVNPAPGEQAFIEVQYTGPVVWETMKLYQTQYMTPESECTLAASPNLESQRTHLLSCFILPYPSFSTGGELCIVAHPENDTLVDKVAWGSFATSMFSACAASPANAVASGIPQGQSLHRTLGRGCPTLLEQADDTGNDAADFALGAPTPRANDVAPTEKPCEDDGPVDPCRAGPCGPGDGSNPIETHVPVPRARVSSAKLSVRRGGRVSTQVSCEPGPSCGGELGLLARTKVRPDGKRRQVTIAQRRGFQVAGGAGQAVELTLTETGRDLLEKRGKLTARVVGEGIEPRRVSLSEAGARQAVVPRPAASGLIPKR